MISIDTVSHVLNIPKSTLRYWESEGLIHSHREANNYRRYGEREIIDIGDIANYRALGIGVKKISEVKAMNAEQLDEFLLSADDDLASQINKLEETRRLVAEKRGLIRHYQRLVEQGYRVERAGSLGLGAGVASFNILEDGDLLTWMHNPYTERYVCLFEGLNDPDPKDGWIVDDPDASHKLLWANDDLAKRFLETLYVSDARDAGCNNMGAHKRYLESHGLNPGRVIARYLLNLQDAEAGREVACYQLLIELHEDD